MDSSVAIYIMTIVVFASSSTLCQKSFAQAVPFLQINTDVHAMGMAGAGTSLYATAFAMWNNTASTVLSDRKMDIAVSYGLWQPSMAANNVISAAGYGKVAEFMTISAGIKYFTHHPYNMTDSGGLVTGTYTPKEMVTGIGLAFRILPVLSVGANVNYVLSDLGGPKKGSAISADIGAMLDLKFMRVGVTASNLGSKIDYGGLNAYNLPACLKLGVGTTQYLESEKKHSLTASLQGGMLFENNAFMAEAGLEYMWNDIARFSAGYHYGNSAGIIPSYVSLGAGVKFFGIYLNAAYLIGTKTNSQVSNSFVIGLGYSF